MDPNQNPAPETASAPPPVTINPKHKRLASVIALSLLTVFLVFEGAARLWLAYSKKTPIGRPDSLVLNYYPELSSAMKTRIGGRDGRFDVLILSGSAFYKYYGGPELKLKAALEKAGYGKVRMWNMAMPAHTTRDSLIKYRWLEDKKFDWVIVYHGINDLRANNVPEDEFKDDYSHMPWYAEVNALVNKPHSFPRSDLASPLLWNYLRVVRHQLSGPKPTVRHDQPPSEEAAAFGSEIRSAEAVEGNLKDIAEISKKRKDWLTLVTYGSYLDPRYTKERFEHDQAIKNHKTSGTLELSYASASYSDYAQPCEIWGRPENLVEGIKVHNEQVKAVAQKKKVGVVDFAAQVPKEGKYFIDMCHLSPAGVDLLTSCVVSKAPPLKTKTPAAPAAKAGAAATTATAAKAAAATSASTAKKEKP